MLVVSVNVTVAVIVGAARLQWSVRAGSGNESVTLICGREIAGRRKDPNPFVEAGYNAGWRLSFNLCGQNPPVIVVKGRRRMNIRDEFLYDKLL